MMRGWSERNSARWWVGLGPPPSPLAPGADRWPIATVDSGLQLLRRLEYDRPGEAYERLRETVERVQGRWAAGPTVETVLRAAAWLMVQERLQVWRAELPFARTSNPGADIPERRIPGKKGPLGPPPKDPAKDKTHWIEIELIDQQGRPVPGRAYEITLPDGTIARGLLDEFGRARRDGIPGGMCKVTFPKIHGPEWWDA